MINHLLKQDSEIVKIETDRYGDVIESVPYPVKCRAVEEFKMIKNNAGVEVVTSIQFWMNPNVDLSNATLEKRRINYNGFQYTPISVKNKRNTHGEPFLKVVYV